MEFKKIIKQVDRYDIVQWEFKGMPTTFRFSKANGYKSVDDMAENTIGKAKFKELFGGVPEWIRASPNGDFTFVGVNPALFN